MTLSRKGMRLSEVEHELQRVGFTFARQAGAHRYYTNEAGQRLTIATHTAGKLDPGLVDRIHHKVMDLLRAGTPLSDTELAAMAVTENDESAYCPGCKTRKPRSAFYGNTRHHNGLQSYCKACQTARVLASRERAAARVVVHVATPEPLEEAAPPEAPTPEAIGLPATGEEFEHRELAAAVLALEQAADVHGFSLAEWLDVRQVPSIFVTERFTVLLYGEHGTDEVSCWILTPDGSGPGEHIPAGLVGYITRLLAGGDTTRQSGRVYY